MSFLQVSAAFSRYEYVRQRVYFKPNLLKPVVIPEKPELKHRTGETSLDMRTVQKTSYWITIIQLPVICLAVIITFILITELDGFHQDVNIGKLILSNLVTNSKQLYVVQKRLILHISVFTTDQFEFFTVCCIAPFFLLAIIATIGKQILIFL